MLSNGARLVDLWAQAFKVGQFMAGPKTLDSKRANFQSKALEHIPGLGYMLLYTTDISPTYNNIEVLPKFAKHYPNGCSIKCLSHYGQLSSHHKRYPKFQNYDYGKTKNLEIYNSETPPEYDLSLINVPVRGFVAIDDVPGNLIDNGYLKCRLREYGVDYLDFVYSDAGHSTFILGKEPENIFNDIKSCIGNNYYEKNLENFFKKAGKKIIKKFLK